MSITRRSGTVTKPVLAGAVVLVCGVSGALFEAGFWILGFCVLAASGALAYLERSRAAPVVGPPVKDVVEGLVSMVETEWTAELEDRGVFSGSPLSVCWTPLVRSFDSDRETHSSGDIADYYRSTASTRLIILGRPGAGKTILAIQLARQLVNSRDGTDRVPVVLSLSSWHPSQIRFADWLKDRLATNYPSLSALDVTGRRIADVLVEERKILPVLDGLDEMSLPQRSAAVSAIGRLAPFPFVVTCRTEEYRTLTGAGDAASRGFPLWQDVVAVEVDPLDASAIHDYLSVGEHSSSSQVLRHVADNPEGSLAVALSTPLMCFLLKTGYADPVGMPADLISLAETSPAGFEEHLLQRFMSAVLDPRQTGPKSVRNWDVGNATRWLTYLAQSLTKRNERDLIPWQMHESLANTGPLRIVLSGAVSGCVLGVAIGLGGWAASTVLSLSAQHLGIASAPAPLISTPWGITLTIGALALWLGPLQSTQGSAFRAAPAGHVSRITYYSAGALVRLLTGIIGGAGIAFLSTAAGSLGLIASVALAGGVVMGTAAWALSDWSREWRLGRSPRRIRIGVHKIPDALVYGLGGGLVTALGSAVLIGYEASVLVAGGAVAMGIAVNLLDERADVAEADRAASVLASDRWATMLQLACLGVVVGLFTHFVDVRGPITPLVFGVSMGLGAGLALGIAGASSGGIPVMFPSTVWIRYLTAKWWLALGHHVPLRLLAFLEDACTLGVMRRVGAVYQFRHIDFQRHFSEPGAELQER